MSAGTLVIAHRGHWAHSGAPLTENSLAAVRSALASGCDGVEVDVRRSSDGVLVLRHDPLPAGTTRDEDGEPLATLQEVLALTLERGVLLVVDVKGRRPGPAVWSALATELGEVPPDRRPLVVVQSPDAEALRALSGVVPGLRTAVLGWPPLRRGGAGVPTWAVSRPRWGIPGSTIARDHARGRQVLAWTVNREDEMRRLVAAGADGIITDRPDLLLGLLRRGGGSPDGGSGSAPVQRPAPILDAP